MRLLWHVNEVGVWSIGGGLLSGRGKESILRRTYPVQLFSATRPELTDTGSKRVLRNTSCWQVNFNHVPPSTSVTCSCPLSSFFVCLFVFENSRFRRLRIRAGLGFKSSPRRVMFIDSCLIRQRGSLSFIHLYMPIYIYIYISYKIKSYR